MEGDKRNLIPVPDASIPGPVLSHKCTVSVWQRELLPFVENELKRCNMCPQQYVWDNRLCDKVWPCCHAVIHVRADITVRPPIEPFVGDVGKIIGRDIVAHAVALIYGGPQLASLLIAANAYGIPQPAGVDPHVLPIRVGNQNGCTAGIGLD